jgi:hypothetical protein
MDFPFQKNHLLFTPPTMAEGLAVVRHLEPVALHAVVGPGQVHDHHDAAAPAGPVHAEELGPQVREDGLEPEPELAALPAAVRDVPDAPALLEPRKEADHVPVRVGEGIPRRCARQGGTT